MCIRDRGLTISPVTKPSRPTAATKISAAAQTSLRFLVLEWQMVTVAFFAEKLNAEDNSEVTFDQVLAVGEEGSVKDVYKRQGVV